MAAYLIALGKIHDPERFDKYLEGVMPTLAPYSAEILSIEDSEMDYGTSTAWE